MASGHQFVGNYRMYHLIRAGAVYEIWAVRPMSETDLYAIKWLPPGRKYTRDALTQLKHEYAVGKTLDHPEVIKTYEFNTTKSDGAYMLLEYFKTPNMKQQIVGGVEALRHRVRQILVNSAAGLAHMHEQGWIHRDIKPDNYLVSDTDEVRLIDFNLACKPQGTLGKLLGSKMKVQGTHSYMAPEQIRGQGVDARADVYSFGCMTYELMTGRAPFTASSPNELLQRHLRTKPQSLTVADKNVHPDFADYVQRLLAKDRNERPANMKEVQMELKIIKMFHQQPQAPEPDATEKSK